MKREVCEKKISKILKSVFPVPILNRDAVDLSLAWAVSQLTNTVENFHRQRAQKPFVDDLKADTRESLTSFEKGLEIAVGSICTAQESIVDSKPENLSLRCLAVGFNKGKDDADGLMDVSPLEKQILAIQEHLKAALALSQELVNVCSDVIESRKPLRQQPIKSDLNFFAYDIVRILLSVERKCGSESSKKSLIENIIIPLGRLAGLRDDLNENTLGAWSERLKHISDWAARPTYRRVFTNDGKFYYAVGKVEQSI